MLVHSSETHPVVLGQIRRLLPVLVGLASLICGGAASLAGGIGNLVFRDQNRNRQFDPADSGVANVTLHLYSVGQTPGVDAPVQVDVTDSAGRYLFEDVADGEYFVLVVPTAFRSGGALVNTRSVPGTPGDANQDDDAGENGIDALSPSTSGVRSGTVRLQAGAAPVSEQDDGLATETGFDNGSDDAADGDTDLTVDFGFESYTTRIGDFVWWDQNRNGLQDPGEPGLPDVRVQLFSQAGEYIADTVSAADGYYGFTNVEPGTYYLQFPQLVFPYQLTLAEQDPDDLLDSDVSTLYGATPSFEVVALQNNTQYDAGYVMKLPDLGDFVFYDANANGVQDAGEGGLEGVKVELHAEDGGLVAEDWTDADGYYQFTGVLPGRYFIQFPPAFGGLKLSKTGQGLDAGSDSDADPESGRTVVFEAFAGLDDDSRDAGYHQPPATIQGLAWHDVNKNGIRETGDDPIAGVTVILQDAASGQDMATAETDAEGHYEFIGVASQAWRVLFPRYAGDKEQYQLTQQDAGADDWGDSDVSTSDLLTASVTPVNGQTVVLDAGYRDVRLGIGNGVFKDYNGSGTFNAGEGVMNVRVELYTNTEVPGLVGATTTSVGGTYYFNDLAPGKYFVRIPASQFQGGGPLAGWISLPGNGLDDQLDDNQGENGQDAAYPAASGIRSNVVNLASGTEPRSSPGTETGRENAADNTDDFHIDLTVDFGFTPGMTLGNLVFRDVDRNGVFSPGEGAGQVTLELLGGGMTPGQDEPLGTVVTDSAGHYQFAGLMDGTYVVHVPAGNFALGGPLAGLASVPGAGGAAGGDDGVDENGLDDGDEALAGVSAAPVVLTSHQAPTAAGGETGQGSAADDADDGMGWLTLDFGFRTAPPASYAAWRVRENADGADAPAQDHDADGWPNALEYFFNLSVQSPTAPRQPVTLAADPGTGLISLSMVFNPRAREAMPAPGFRTALRDGVGSGEWEPITSMVPTREDLADGTARLTWGNLESLPGMAGGAGFVRMAVEFDTDGDGSPDTTFPCGVLGWRERTHRTGLATTGFSLLKPSLYQGSVTGSAVGAGVVSLTFAAAAAGDLAALMGTGRPCYAEVATGAWTGHRFEVRESSSAGNVLVLEGVAALNTLTAVPDLTGALVVLREHWTLAEVFPPAAFVASNNPTAADRVLRFTRPSFTTFWLLDLGGARRWVQADDVFLTDAGTLPIPPGEGLFMERIGVAQGVLDIGEVRPHRMARRLTAGNSLVTSGWPEAGSPRSWGLLAADGFSGSNNPALADAFQIWQADAEGGQRALRGYFLLDAGAPWQYWAAKSDATLQNQDDVPLFAPGQAIFLQTHAPLHEGYEPCPWTP